MPTNKTPFSFYLDDNLLMKIKHIAKNETRSISNLLEHLCKIHVIEYEKQNGVIVVKDEDYK